LANAAEADSGYPGLIIREKEPLNLEFPFPTLDHVITPTNRFFVRSHFPIPKLEAKAWRLKIDGSCEHPLELSLDDIRNMPAKSVTATIECAGNGRAFLAPKAKGVQWELGAVGNATWTGVPLRAVLERAGLKADTVEVILSGSDQGEITEEPKSPGTIHFERSLPLAKAQSPEVLLAYQMNGEDLTAEHGFPLRVIVPGWFGMASVKWLSQITATNVAFHGYWQSLEYAYFERQQGRPSLVPVTQMQVKSSIARPALGELVPADKRYRVHGATWTGESEVSSVEVSTDDARTWQAAELLGEAVPHSWRLWQFDWHVPKQPGRVRLMCRASDRAGNQQPQSRDKDRRGYLINHVVPVEVNVR